MKKNERTMDRIAALQEKLTRALYQWSTTEHDNVERAYEDAIRSLIKNMSTIVRNDL